jgi:hypothetical protein
MKGFLYAFFKRKIMLVDPEIEKEFEWTKNEEIWPSGAPLLVHFLRYVSFTQINEPRSYLYPDTDQWQKRAITTGYRTHRTFAV